MEKNILEITSLSKSFQNVRAVNNLSFNVGQGDVFAFIGPNGAGKTTTLRILLDIIKADSGSVIWKIGTNSNSVPAASQIGYLPEERGLYTDLPVIRSLVYLASIRGMQASAAKTAAMHWLERLELADRAGEKLLSLSKGNQQKIQFVSAILHKPAFAILDEPFSGLDPLNQEKFIGFIRELNQQGTTVLLSAHQMDLVEKIANKVFLINKGEKIFNGSLPELLSSFGKTQIIDIEFEGENPYENLILLPEVDRAIQQGPNSIRIFMSPGLKLNMLLAKLSDIETVNSIKSQNSSLHDIFINLVNTNQA